jgi:WD40 repeat protein
VAVCGDCTVRRWDLPAGTEVPLPGGYVWYVSIAYAPDGRTVAAADAGGRIDLRDPVTGTVRATAHAPQLEYGSLAFTPDGKPLAGGHADGAIRSWDAATGAERRVLRLPPKGKALVALLAFSPDGRRLLRGVRKGPSYLWDLATGRTLWEGPCGYRRKAVFSPDGPA